MKGLQERLEEMKNENAKLARSKKKVQEEVWNNIVDSTRALYNTSFVCLHTFID